MSEFIEIGSGEEDGIFRVSHILSVTQEDNGLRLITTIMGEEYETEEPYESIRDKLMGKTTPVVDLRGEFADQVVFMLERLGHKDAAAAVRVHYRSLMLSETEGAG